MIIFDHVTKQYEDTGTVALKDFSLHIERGELVAITGMSGSGKTTLLNLLMKIIEPTEGRIFVAGKDLSHIKGDKVPYYRRTIGMVFQDYRLMSDKTAYDNVAISMLAVGGRKKNMANRIGSVFSLLGISSLHGRYPHEMSGGQCQKVCLARALINRPQILLCDEPTGNLDPENSQQIFELIKLIHNQGITVVVVTHDVERASALGCRMIHMGDSEE